ncbi:MAG TPA: hypothetical protein VNY52_07145 [Solirubrobacteraceae bacterium]|nr:hypothetical protein [Solirubrobacteraceae bacterium]
MTALIAWVTENREAISQLYPYEAPPFDHLQSYWENFYRGPRKGDDHAAVLEPSEPPAFRFLGFELGIPFGVPACAVTPHSGYVDYFARRGFDLITYKTVRNGPWNPHPSPNLAFAAQVRTPLAEADLEQPVIPTMYPDALNGTTDASFVNSIGVPSLPVEQWMADVARTRGLLRAGQVLIVSVMGSPELLDRHDVQGLIDQFERVACAADEAGTDIIELNLSCPNTGGQLICLDPELSGRITAAVRRRVGDTPILIKICHMPEPELAALVTACRPSMNGVVAINAVQVHAQRPDGGAFFADRKDDFAGLSGVGIRGLGLAVTRSLSRLRGDEQASPDDWVIVGIGGVASAADYQAYKDAGADAVQSCTGAWLNPHLAHEVRVHALGARHAAAGDTERPSVVSGRAENGAVAAGARTHPWLRLFHAVNDTVRTGALNLRVEEPEPRDARDRRPR